MPNQNECHIKYLIILDPNAYVHTHKHVCVLNSKTN